MAVPEHDGAVAHPREQALLVRFRLRREALDVGERRAVHVEDAVELDLRGQSIEPLEHVVGEHPDHVLLVRRPDLRDVGELTRPPLAVPADPDRVRQRLEPLERLERPWARDSVVAAEQPAVDAELVGLREHRLERGQVAVDVVEQAEHAALDRVLEQGHTLTVARSGLLF